MSLENKEKDTIIHKENSILYFDKKNRIVKQIDYYLKFINETDFNYKNNLLNSLMLASLVSKKVSTISKLQATHSNISS